METKHKFKITLSVEENAETKLWSGKCTHEELYQKFNEAIKTQLIIYNTDHKERILRAYDEIDRMIAQETLHGVS